VADFCPEFHVFEHRVAIGGNEERFSEKLPENLTKSRPIWAKPALRFSSAMRCAFQPPGTEGLRPPLLRVCVRAKPVVTTRTGRSTALRSRLSYVCNFFPPGQ
jgi:hypothetical protein